MSMMSHLDFVRAALADERARVKRVTQVEDTDFLPAALEVIERPVSPTIRMTARLLVGGLLLLLLWMAFGRIDVVASAIGKVIPADNVKLVQPSEPGVVRRILVQEGQHVARGQPLVLLDPTDANAEAAEARKALETTELDAARARAVLSALDGHGLAFAAPPGTDPATAAASRALARAQLDQVRAEATMQAGDARAARAAVSEAQRQAAKLDETLPLLDEQIAANEKLLAKGYVSKLKVIEMRRTRIGAARDRDIALATIRRAGAQSDAAGGGVARAGATARAAVLGDLVKAEADARLRREELVKATRRAALRTLTAPVAGTVSQLSLHTEGGMVESVKPIMAIVPDSGGLAVEARVLGRDAGYVRPGQAVAVKLDAFPFTRFGAVPGHVVRVGTDAVEDEKLGLVYVARVVLDRATVDRGDAVVPIVPGMAATVDVKTGRRSILDYLLSPIEAAGRTAARER